jgi:sortase (surface protein transpeptidase)
MGVGQPSPRLAALAVAALLIATGCTGASGHTATDRSTTTATTAEWQAATSVAPAPTRPPPTSIRQDVQSFEAARGYDSSPVPVTVEIPAIGVMADLDELHRNPDGTIQVPDWNHAGWWADGPKPGQLGPAVILAHVDNKQGPDIFFRLNELHGGDEVIVTRADGTTVRFTVERVERHPKDAFPTEAVYGPTLDPGLRLVTCGGEFDRSVGHYRDNIIVFANLTP